MIIPSTKAAMRGLTMEGWVLLRVHIHPKGYFHSDFWSRSRGWVATEIETSDSDCLFATPLSAALALVTRLEDEAVGTQ